MNLKKFARHMCKEGQVGLATKMTNFAGKTQDVAGTINSLTKRVAKPVTSLSRKINTTTPYGMV